MALTSVRRVNQLDWLKAIAVIMVVITHTLQSLNVYDKALAIGRPFLIDMAVPIFMIISGFTYSLSAEKNDIDNIKKWYTKKCFLSKISRVIFPYIVVIILEIIAYQLYSPKSLSQYIIGFITGGWGPGSYYFPILIQLIIIFPFIYLITKKNNVIGLIIFFSIHFIFDYISIKLLFPITDDLYRLSIFRYLSFLVIGILFYLRNQNIFKNKVLKLSLVLLSALFILFVNYFHYKPVIFSKWTVTSLPTVFWALGIVLLGFKIFPDYNKGYINRMISYIGKASYHIFLFQMAYFNFGFGVFGHLMSIFTCVLSGVFFYKIESIIREKHSIIVKKKRCGDGSYRLFN